MVVMVKGERQTKTEMDGWIDGLVDELMLFSFLLRRVTCFAFPFLSIHHSAVKL